MFPATSGTRWKNKKAYTTFQLKPNWYTHLNQKERKKKERKVGILWANLHSLQACRHHSCLATSRLSAGGLQAQTFKRESPKLLLDSSTCPTAPCVSTNHLISFGSVWSPMMRDVALTHLKNLRVSLWQGNKASSTSHSVKELNKNNFKKFQNQGKCVSLKACVSLNT